MRKALIVLVAVTAAAWAGGSIQRRSRIGPARATADVALAAPGAGVRNCLGELDTTSDAAYRVNVLDAGTTIYTVALSSGAGMIRSWDDESAPCAGANALLTINVDGGNFNINYSGFTY